MRVVWEGNVADVRGVTEAEEFLPGPRCRCHRSRRAASVRQLLPLPLPRQRGEAPLSAGAVLVVPVAFRRPLRVA